MWLTASFGAVTHHAKSFATHRLRLPDFFFLKNSARIFFFNQKHVLDIFFGICTTPPPPSKIKWATPYLNPLHSITCTLCKKLYIGETGRRLGDRFREHLRDVEKDDQNASKPVARHFNLPNHSNQHMVVCGLSLHQGSTESRKTLEQKFIFQIGTLNPNGINERFSFN